MQYCNCEFPIIRGYDEPYCVRCNQKLNNMTPREKAIELVNRHYKLITDGGTIDEAVSAQNKAIECAKVTVDEIIELGVAWIDEDLQRDYPKQYTIDGTEEFWIKVKNELNITEFFK